MPGVFGAKLSTEAPEWLHKGDGVGDVALFLYSHVKPSQTEARAPFVPTLLKLTVTPIH